MSRRYGCYSDIPLSTGEKLVDIHMESLNRRYRKIAMMSPEWEALKAALRTYDPHGLPMDVYGYPVCSLCTGERLSPDHWSEWGHVTHELHPDIQAADWHSVECQVLRWIDDSLNQGHNRHARRAVTIGELVVGARYLRLYFALTDGANHHMAWNKVAPVTQSYYTKRKRHTVEASPLTIEQACIPVYRGYHESIWRKVEEARNARLSSYS